MVGMNYWTVALVAVSTCIQALVYVLWPRHKGKELRRAFEALEEEFEELRDTVRSGLGRISRLKRTMLQEGTIPPENPAPADVDTTVEDGVFPGLTPSQKKWQERIMARRRGGVN